jgi:hypothetical protein
MTRVFLSYAAEDGTTADRLMSLFISVGIRSFSMQD